MYFAGEMPQETSQERMRIVTARFRKRLGSWPIRSTRQFIDFGRCSFRTKRGLMACGSGEKEGAGPTDDDHATLSPHWRFFEDAAWMFSYIWRIIRAAVPHAQDKGFRHRGISHLAEGSFEKLVAAS
jgi:hypothetical protein